MASLHELDTYEISEPYESNSRHGLHAVTDKKAKPENYGCSPWITGCIGIIAVLALCVSVTMSVLLFTSSEKIFIRTDVSADKQGSTDVKGDKITPGITPEITTKKTPPTVRATETTPVENNQYGGSTYVRWGRTVCPETSTLVYAGLAGGKWFSHTGSGSNYLCLPHDPEYDEYDAGEQVPRALVYSAEYQPYEFSPLSDKHDHDVPCAVCHVTNRASLMFPAKMTCPSGWIREYYGYLMAERYNHQSTEFVCVDRSPEIVPGSIVSKDGALFYPTEGRCTSGNLPCSPYINGAELTCVVCSK